MGWHDRDYSHPARGDGALARLGLGGRTRVATILIVVHAAAFFLLLMFHLDGAPGLGASLALSGESARPLAVLTHAYATGNIVSLLLTVYALWAIGSRIEERDGAHRMLALYFLGNLAAGAAYYAIAMWRPNFAGVVLDSPIGAIAAWLISFRRSLSDETMELLGRTIRLPHLIAAAVMLAILLLIAFSGVGAAAWLGAIAAGVMTGEFVERRSIPRRESVELPDAEIVPRKSPLRAIAAVASQRSKVSAHPQTTPATPTPSPLPDIDPILAKISREGFAALSDAEREQLEAARQAMLKQRGASK
ncbi:MAG: rhomboid family intramembrane serine protease [Phycisphaerae bacterium]